MKITLPPDVLKSLPQPASDDGLVHVPVALKLGADGSAELVQVGNTPVPSDDDTESPAEDAAAREESDAPAPPDADQQAQNDYMASASQGLQNL